MDFQSIIDKYYPQDNELRHILITHSRKVADKALKIVDNHPELGADRQFVEEAAMLHDIGIFLTEAPSIYCFGNEPYMRHGLLGAELLRKEGFPRHALVCERHTGTGLTQEEIIAQKLPLPIRDFSPVSIEEQIVCYADIFYSKTKLEQEKTIDTVLTKIAKFGPEGVARFKHWVSIFE